MGQGIGAVRCRRPRYGGWLAGAALAGAALAGGVGPAPPAAAQAGCKVPDVRGTPVEQAKQRIQQALAGRPVHLTIKVDPPTAPGRTLVIAQDVTGCRGDQPRSVTVYLSAGATVPDVAGHTRQDAEEILGKVGLVAHADPQGTGDVVVSQSPEPGTRARFGTRVILTLGQGTGTGTAGTVAVPDLGGLTEVGARRRLGKELRLVVVQAAGREPVVIRQDPRPGATAKRGDVVRVSLGPPPAGPTRATSTTGGSTTSPSTGTGGSTGGTGGTGGKDGAGASDDTPALAGWFSQGLAVLVLVAIAAAVGGRRLVTRRPWRRPERAPGRVHAEPHGDPVPDVSASADPAGRSLTVRLQPHGDQGTQRLGEGPR